MYAFSLAIFCCSDLISIARCVDRDMLMCFCGLDVGHKNTWHETQVLRKEISEVFNIPDHYEDSGDTRM